MPVIKLKNRPGITKLSKAPEKRATMDDILDRVDVIRGGKGEDGKTPVKGVDYFTKDEINAWLKSVTPIKGKHYFDGNKGDKGDAGVSNIPGPKGEDGKDADEDVIVGKVLQRIPKPKDGKDGTIPDLEDFKKEILETITELKGKKLGTKDVDGLENRLNQLAAKVEKNYGGHGGTPKNISYTYSNGVATLKSSPTLGDMEVYVGGGRLFFESQDFVSTIGGGNKVTAITLSAAAQADIAQGSTLIVRGK
jgi:hypothetical protein